MASVCYGVGEVGDAATGFGDPLFKVCFFVGEAVVLGAEFGDKFIADAVDVFCGEDVLGEVVEDGLIDDGAGDAFGCAVVVAFAG